MVKLALMVTSSDQRQRVEGFVRTALERGHEVGVFFTDEGTTLVADPGVRALIGRPGLSLAACAHSAQLFGVAAVAGIEFGGQYQNAVMLHAADKALVF
ncbi:MAG: hypothetical protein ACYDAG_12175 [Chloroflexota bacterium]